MNRKKGKLIFLVASLLTFTLWFFLSLSQSGRKIYAQRDMETVLFEYNRINPHLFSGPIVKYSYSKEWFEWYHIEGSDTITVGITVSRIRFLNFFLEDNYLLGKDSLWNKVFETDPLYNKTKSE